MPLTQKKLDFGFEVKIFVDKTKLHEIESNVVRFDILPVSFKIIKKLLREMQSLSIL